MGYFDLYLASLRRSFREMQLRDDEHIAAMIAGRDSGPRFYDPRDPPPRTQRVFPWVLSLTVSAADLAAEDIDSDMRATRRTPAGKRLVEARERNGSGHAARG